MCKGDILSDRAIIKERTPRPRTAKSVPGQGCPRTGDGCPGTRYRGHFWLSQDTLSWDIYPTVLGHLTYEFFLKRARRSVGGVSLKESMLLVLMVLSVFLLNAVFAS